MRRVFFLLLIPFVLLISNPVMAARLNDYQLKKAAIQEQMKEIQTKSQSAEGNEKLKLGMEINKLAAYEAAYQKAIDLMQQPQQNDTDFDQSVLYNIVPLSSYVSIAKSPGEAVPAEYISYYKAAGKLYGVDWTILAAIHKIETNYSRIRVMISSVGAVGPMQFMPATFAEYGVDGNGDGMISPWNIQDSIYTAARYLAANGYKNNIRGAIWSYNHADWYVNEVLNKATMIKNEKG